MSCDRGPVSSYIRPRCGPGAARTAATTRATSAAATGEVLPRPNGSSMRPRSRTVGPTRRRKKPSRKTVGRMVTTGRPDRSEERRVGKEGRRGGAREQGEKEREKDERW